MIFISIIYLTIFILWCLIKRRLWKWVITTTILLTPAVIMAIRSGYIYSAAIALLVLAIVLVYDFKAPNYLSWKKSLVALPFLSIFIYITNTNRLIKELSINISELVISIIIICLSLFIAGFGSLLILSRTRGERTND